MTPLLILATGNVPTPAIGVNTTDEPSTAIYADLTRLLLWLSTACTLASLTTSNQITAAKEKAPRLMLYIFIIFGFSALSTLVLPSLLSLESGKILPLVLHGREGGAEQVQNLLDKRQKDIHCSLASLGLSIFGLMISEVHSMFQSAFEMIKNFSENVKMRIRRGSIKEGELCRVCSGTLFNDEEGAWSSTLEELKGVRVLVLVVWGLCKYPPL
jgi:hypothetical protein